MSSRSLKVLVEDVARVLQGVGVVLLKSTEQQAATFSRRSRLLYRNNASLQCQQVRETFQDRAQQYGFPPTPQAPPQSSQTASSHSPNTASIKTSSSSTNSQLHSQESVTDEAGSLEIEGKSEFHSTNSSADIQSSADLGLKTPEAASIKQREGEHKPPVEIAGAADASESPAKKSESVEDAKTKNESTRTTTTSRSDTVQQQNQQPVSKSDSNPSTNHRSPRERRIPSNSAERAAGFGAMAISIAAGTAVEQMRRVFTGDRPTTSPVLSTANATRLAAGLCRMRGAALKVGQMISIQDGTVLPPDIQLIMDRVRDGADIMPRRQLTKLMNSEFGDNWEEIFTEFNYTPIASASIGQVHAAKLGSTQEQIALKIQFPGVAKSIDSDLNNMKKMITYFDLFPRGIYMDEVLKAAREELSQECDYRIEAASQDRMRELLKDDDYFNIPKVHFEHLTPTVLVSDYVSGLPLDKCSDLPQEIRNEIGTNLLRLTLKELFEIRFMQTDPNWSNFLYNVDDNVLNLIDFGAAREFPKLFVDSYIRMVHACTHADAENVLKYSNALGFTTGDESKPLQQLHIEAGFALGEPFRYDEPYDFHKTDMIVRMSKLGSEIMGKRLTAPPQEAYSLHRKLTGCFLSCLRLKAQVPCKKLFMGQYNSYEF